MELWLANGKHYIVPENITEEQIKELVKSDYINPVILKRTDTKYYILPRKIEE